MLDWLSSLGSLIVTLVNLVVHTVQSFLHFMLMMPTYSSFLTSAINVVPSIFIPFLLASISLYIVLFVIGRQA